MIKDLIKDDDENMDNYDPQEELSGIKRQISNNPGEGNIGLSRDTWKMNYKMKNELSRKAEKEQLIKEVIIPKLRESVVHENAMPLVEDTKKLITQIDEYQAHAKDLDQTLAEVNK